MDDRQFERLVELIEMRFGRIEQRLDRIEERLDRNEHAVTALRNEMLERFQSIDDRLATIDLHARQLGEAVVDMRKQVSKVAERMEQITNEMYDLKQRFNGLGEDMRQRFRLVTERLHAVEQNLAA